MNVPCAELPIMSDDAYWMNFSKKFEEKRIPVSGGIALTHRCNLACLHCYAVESAEKKHGDRPELGTAQWKKIIDEIQAAGCLYLLITGGEPLLREDFADIYAYAKRQGFLVTLFTNATLVTDDTVELLRRLPPRRVEVTLYGASAATHDRITGVAGSFERTLFGIERLHAAGLNVTLKSVLMTLNMDEFPAIEKIAKKFAMSFRLDAAIFPSLAGDRSPLDLRVTAEQAVAVELANPEVREEARRFLNRFRASETDQLYACSAGSTVFHIDPYGCLYPCVMVRRPSYPLTGGSFRERWQAISDRVSEMKLAADSACRGCKDKLLCGYCPGFFLMENGSEEKPSPYLCDLGKMRTEMISQDAPGG